MNKNIRIRVAVQVLGIMFLLFLAAVSLIVPTIRWSWEEMWGDLGHIFIVLIVVIAGGSIRIIRRLRPVEEFRKCLESGEPADREILDRARHIALIFPVSSALIAWGVFTAGGIWFSISLQIKFDARLYQSLIMFLMAFSLGGFGAIFCFFSVKKTMEPVVERLIFEDPDFLNLSPPMRLRLRPKLLITFISLGVLMAMFALFGNTQISDTVRSVVEAPATAQEVINATHFVLIWNVAACLIVAAVIGFLAAGDLSRPLRQITAAAENIATGEHKQRIPIITEDEIGELASSINRMSFGLLENLTQTLEKSEKLLETVREASETLRSHSWEVSSIASRQSEGASQQSASAQEAGSTSMEISQSAKQIAQGTQRFHELAQQARESCDDGEESLQETISDIRNSNEYAQTASDVIKELATRSGKIQSVVDIIEEISSQINLLSLNAALEAVDAGVAGRRFKTVAQEVGRLAEKTNESIYQIRKMVNEIWQYTGRAADVVNKTSEVSDTGAEKAARLENSFKTIRETVEGTVAAAKEIELTTNQQSTASDQMVEAISAITDNARELEESAKQLDKNIENLAVLTDRLGEMASGKI